MKIKKLFIEQAGQFRPICDFHTFPKLLKINVLQMSEVFGHFAKFGTGGKVFGSPFATKCDLKEAQTKLDIIKRTKKAQKRSKKNLTKAKNAIDNLKSDELGSDHVFDLLPF
jgi:hypothetical protein